MANGTDDFQREPRVVSEKVARVSLVQLTVVGLALFCLLVAWKEANSVGEQLRSSIVASELLVEKEAQCQLIHHRSGHLHNEAIVFRKGWCPTGPIWRSFNTND